MEEKQYPSVTPTNHSSQTQPRKTQAVQKLKEAVLQLAVFQYPSFSSPSEQADLAKYIEDRLLSSLPCPLRAPNHPSYAEMIVGAIRGLNEEMGSSEESISCFIQLIHPELPWAHPRLLAHHLEKLVQLGVIVCGHHSLYSLPKSNPRPEIEHQNQPIPPTTGLKPSLQKKKRRPGRPRKAQVQQKQVDRCENVGVGIEEQQQKQSNGMLLPNSKWQLDSSSQNPIDRMEVEQQQYQPSGFILFRKRQLCSSSSHPEEEQKPTPRGRNVVVIKRIKQQPRQQQLEQEQMLVVQTLEKNSSPHGSCMKKNEAEQQLVVVQTSETIQSADGEKNQAVDGSLVEHNRPKDLTMMNEQQKTMQGGRGRPLKAKLSPCSHSYPEVVAIKENGQQPMQQRRGRPPKAKLHASSSSHVKAMLINEEHQRDPEEGDHPKLSQLVKFCELM